MPVMDRIEGSTVDADLSHSKRVAQSVRARSARCFLLSVKRMESSAQSMKADLLGQLILTGVPGPELDTETAALFRRVQPGGFILFGRNIKAAPQLRALIDDLRGLSEIEPIITIDQEGGRVSRLRLIGNEPPNAQQLRDRNDLALVRRHGESTGQ